jgi:DNA-binding response OmpR family regulator
LKKIFIVEDDKSLNSLYEKILRLNGFEVVGIAEDGEEAIYV